MFVQKKLSQSLNVGNFLMSHNRLNQACGNSGIADQLLYHVTATRSDFVFTVMKEVLALKTDCTIKNIA